MRNVKKEIALCSAAMIICSSMLTACAGKGAVIYDAAGGQMLKYSNAGKWPDKLEDKGKRAYLEIVIDEAAGIISGYDGSTIEQAKEKIIKEKYSVYTMFDAEAYEAMENVYYEYEDKGTSFGGALTDLQGNLIAAYSSETTEEYENYASEKTAPYSSFKPLSVYTPALENGVITWSEMFEDSPVKQIESSNGEKSDWPSNVDGYYSEENIAVAEAVKKSVNTVAVKCLQEYGVMNSITYLKETFGLELPEESKVYISGEEEVLGNIGLGYLEEGVSPVEMAGYYQVFANGGYYEAPKTILKICDADGNIIYTDAEEPEQVMTGEVSYVMNQMLQKVTEAGGTAEKARCGNIKTGGKTGTGQDGNWFVGFTPEYSCAVWHGKELANNNAADMFSQIIEKLDHQSEKEYPTAGTVREAVYCTESGKLLSDKCKGMERAIYLSVNCPEKCSMHGE